MVALDERQQIQRVLDLVKTVIHTFELDVGLLKTSEEQFLVLVANIENAIIVWQDQLL